MPEFIQEDVRDVMENPDRDTTVKLVVGIHTDADTEAIKASISDISGEILEEIPFDTMYIELSEGDIDELVQIDGIESIEFNRDIEVLSSGNSGPL